MHLEIKKRRPLQHDGCKYDQKLPISKKGNFLKNLKVLPLVKFLNIRRNHKYKCSYGSPFQKKNGSHFPVG